jgi:hypothetical protein
MSSSQDVEKKSVYELSPEEKGLFLASVGTRSKRRPYSPITVACILSNTPSACDKELSKKLPISARMVGMFKSLLSLPETIQPYVAWTGGISIDKAQRIASLKDDLVSQHFLAKAIMDNPAVFTAPIVAKIVSRKSRNKDLPIDACVNMVLKSRPIVENRYVLVTSISGELIKLLEKKAEEQEVSPHNLLKEVLRQNIPENTIVSMVMHNGIILLILEGEGWSVLRQKAGALGVPIDELAENLIKNWLEVEVCQQSGTPLS